MKETTLYQDTLDHGGATVSRNLEHVTVKGWAVGGALGIRTGIVPANAPIAFYQVVSELQRQGAPYIGTWLDGGAIHIDAVSFIPDTRIAYLTALQRGELAIYHLQHELTLWVSRDG